MRRWEVTFKSRLPGLGLGVPELQGDGPPTHRSNTNWGGATRSFGLPKVNKKYPSACPSTFYIACASLPGGGLVRVSQRPRESCFRAGSTLSNKNKSKDYKWLSILSNYRLRRIHLERTGGSFRVQ